MSEINKTQNSQKAPVHDNCHYGLYKVTTRNANASKDLRIH